LRNGVVKKVGNFLPQLSTREFATSYDCLAGFVCLQVSCKALVDSAVRFESPAAAFAKEDSVWGRSPHSHRGKTNFLTQNASEKLFSGLASFSIEIVNRKRIICMTIVKCSKGVKLRRMLLSNAEGRNICEKYFVLTRTKPEEYGPFSDFAEALARFELELALQPTD
jgi:hypothetical protein